MLVMFRGQYIRPSGVQFWNHIIVSLLFTYGHVGVIEPGLVLGRFASIKWLGLKSASSSPRSLFLTGRKWLAFSGSVEKLCLRKRGSSVLAFISEKSMEHEIDR